MVNPHYSVIILMGIRICGVKETMTNILYKTIGFMLK